jgi:low temperature requirement protein LtrA
MVFFAIWWAWMNFVWFASAFDTDDPLYRIKVLFQMTGALVLAAGVPMAFREHDLTLFVIGYVIMRFALVSQWLRAARSSPQYRRTASRYAVGVSLCQLAWIGFLFVPEVVRWPLFVVFVALELLVPVWAEAATPTPWHARHIAERFGLFTIIVIGESVLAATLAVQAAIDYGWPSISLWIAILATPVIFFSMWWLYFARPHHELLVSSRNAFIWGYAHYVVFGSVAAVGAALALIVDQITHPSEIPDWQASCALTIPVAIYVFSLWFVRVRCETNSRAVSASYLVAAISIPIVSLVFPLPVAIVFVAASLVVLVAQQVFSADN